MFKQKTLSTLLALISIALLIQTYSLYSLSTKLNEAQLKLGAASAIGSSEAPDMVGGC